MGPKKPCDSSARCRSAVRSATAGRPSPGVLLQAEGEGDDYYRGRARTDERGRFEFHVNPGQVYLIAVIHARWAAVPRADLSVRPDTPVERIDLQLLPSATWLHGQLTVGPEKKPWADQTVTLIVRGPDQESQGPSIPRWATTDAEGKYSFTIGPGKYTLWVDSDQRVEKKFTVTDQKELVYDFHAPRKQRGPTTVHVVDQGNPSRPGVPGTPVPGAKVIGVCTSSLQGDLEATTNDNGWFRVERWLGKLNLYAFSKDGKRAGSATIGPDDAEVTIALQPAGGAKGQVIDQSNGRPVANRAVSYAVFYWFDKPEGVGTTCLGDGVTTDAEGRFAITNLVPGIEYQMDMELSQETKPDDRGRNTDRLGNVTAKSGETVDLGAVKFRRDFRGASCWTWYWATMSPATIA